MLPVRRLWCAGGFEGSVLWCVRAQRDDNPAHDVGDQQWQPACRDTEEHERHSDKVCVDLVAFRETATDSGDLLVTVGSEYSDHGNRIALTVELRFSLAGMSRANVALYT